MLLILLTIYTKMYVCLIAYKTENKQKISILYTFEPIPIERAFNCYINCFNELYRLIITFVRQNVFYGYFITFFIITNS